ncbi:amino acid transporter [Lindgomyces ingoldianus]|uniref:Amino acid transporter n=1 Tax=Lindgomyces ingoldianus TaxID=673940 RepID=A0ACB6RAX1_9PLEO|nr:amino acid transporter [Lindgomyces ingoldianus]KAF2475870.1 amino acid transporter [Lindgomyces ingoldianus]
MDKIIELQTLDDEVLHLRRKGLESKLASDFDRDKYELARVGKKQVLKRRFGLVSMTGLTCGLMCTWESLLVVFLIGFQNGGPAGLIYGFFLVWIGNLSVFIAIGELSSMIPTAGGQYHWVSLLAPLSSRRFFSYITGWLTVIGWIAGLTAASYFVAELILDLVTLSIPEFEPTGWNGTLVLWATLLLCVIINVFMSSALPSIEVLVLIVHILGFFGIIIPLVYLTPSYNSAKDVFTTFYNYGEWQTKALSFFIGIQGNALAFVGTDSAVHMSEEVKNASTDVARSMVISLVLNGFLALGMLFAVLFSSPPNIMELAEKHKFPFIQVFAKTVGSNGGAAVMSSIIIVLEFCSALGCLAAASRMTWSFARDRGLPFSRILSMIDKRTTIPVVAIMTVTVFSALLSLVNIGNDTAFADIVSLVLEGFYISYLIAIGLLLWRRLRGDIREPDSTNQSTFNSTEPSESIHSSLTWGPWRLKGALGIANNIFACSYLLLLIFFSFWPGARTVDATQMNYAVLVTGFVVLFSIFYYLVLAKEKYTGPIVEVDLHTL